MSMMRKKKLIPPWKLYNALKPGTIILTNILLHCYIYLKKNQQGWLQGNWWMLLIKRCALNILFPELSNYHPKNPNFGQIRSGSQTVTYSNDDSKNTKGRKMDDLLTSFSMKKNNTEKVQESHS